MTIIRNLLIIYLSILILSIPSVFSSHAQSCSPNCNFTYNIVQKKFVFFTVETSGNANVNNTDISKIITSLPSLPIKEITITETATSKTFNGNRTSDVFIVEGDLIRAWIKQDDPKQLITSSLYSQHENHTFTYVLNASGTQSPNVNFRVTLTAEGRDILRVQDQKSNKFLWDFDSLHVLGGLKVKCATQETTLCLDPDAELDTSRGGNLGVAGWDEVELGAIRHTKTYTFSSNNRCLTTKIETCRKCCFGGGGFWEGYQIVYFKRNETRYWGRFNPVNKLNELLSVNQNQNISNLQNYTAPIGTFDPRSIQIFVDKYNADENTISKNPKEAVLQLSMLNDTPSAPNLKSGPQLWVKTDYRTSYSQSKEGINKTNVDENIKLTDFIQVSAPNNDTVYKIKSFTVNTTPKDSITYTDKQGDKVVEAGDLKAWTSSLSLGGPSYYLFTAFNVTPPLAVIDSITPNPALLGQTVALNGHGERGTVKKAQWSTNRNQPQGNIIKTCLNSQNCNATSNLLVAGQHLISFQVESLMSGGANLLSPTDSEVVRINTPPKAWINYVKSTGEKNGAVISVKYKDDEFVPGHETIDFYGGAVDLDGTISEYKWESHRSGVISTSPSFSTTSLPLGRHVIKFSAKDNDGAWSTVSQKTVIIIRTPILFVHGVCGDNSSWEEESYFKSKNGKLVDDGNIVGSGSFTYSGSPILIPSASQLPNEATMEIYGKTSSSTTQITNIKIPAFTDNYYYSGFGLSTGDDYKYIVTTFHTYGKEFPINKLSIIPANIHVPLGSEQISKEILTTKDRYGVPRINMVVHSMGGLGSRWYIQSSGYRQDVEKLVMLGTPNHGSTGAFLFSPGINEPQSNAHEAMMEAIDSATSIPGTNIGLTDITSGISALLGALGVDLLDCLNTDQATGDLTPQSSFLKQLNKNEKDEGTGDLFFNNYPDDNTATVFGTHVPYFVVLGDAFPTFGHLHLVVATVEVAVPYLFLGDGVVARRSARLDGATLEEMGSGFHIGMGGRERVVNAARPLIGDDPPIRTKAAQATQNASNTTGILGFRILKITNITQLTTQDTKVETFSVPDKIKNINVLLSWPPGSINNSINLSLTLVSSNGTQVNFSSIPQGASISLEESTLIYKINNTDKGNWTAYINIKDAPTDENASNYTLMVYGESSFWVATSEGKVLAPGMPLNITAYVQNDDAPASGQKVSAIVLKVLDEGPKIGTDVGTNVSAQGVQTIALEDKGNGLYNGVFTNTSRTGTYQVVVVAADTQTNLTTLAFSSYFIRENYELLVREPDISFSNNNPQNNEVIRIYATITNNATTYTNATEVWFYDVDGKLGLNTTNITLIAKTNLDIQRNSNTLTSVLYKATPGYHNIHVIVSPHNSFIESNITNNIANKSFSVADNPPTANAGQDQIAILATNIILDASASTDDLKIQKYNWDINTLVDSSGDNIPDNDVDFTEINPVIPSNTYATQGQYNVKLTVFDKKLQSSSDTLTLNITDESDFEPPTANAGQDQIVLTSQPVNFDASLSSDNYAIATYNWDTDISFDSNSDNITDNDVDLFGIKPTLSHGYLRPGVYTAKLEVTDVSVNDPVTDTITITVRDQNTACSIIVPTQNTTSQSIQNVIDLSAPGDVICLSPSTYNLAGQQINLNKNNLTLDCQDATILGTLSSGSTGIRAVPSGTDNLRHITIQNCKVQGYERGILVGTSNPSQVSSVSLIRNVLTNNTYGAKILSSDTHLKQNKALRNINGISEEGSNNVYITNTLSDNVNIGFLGIGALLEKRTPTFISGVFLTLEGNLANISLATPGNATVIASPPVGGSSIETVPVSALSNYTVFASSNYRIDFLDIAPLPAGATFSTNADFTSGLLTWTPTASQVGNYTVAISVYLQGVIVTQYVTLSVVSSGTPRSTLDNLTFIKNTVCSNSVSDINVQASQAFQTQGYNNACNVAINYNDQNKTGCTISCVNLVTPVDVVGNRLSVSQNIQLLEGVYNLIDGIEINTSGITLDCADAIINGSGSNTGLTLNGLNNVNVNGCTFENYQRGFVVSNSTNINIARTNIVSSDVGIESTNTPLTSIKESTIFGKNAAIILNKDSINSIISDNILDSGQDGESILVIGNLTQIIKNQITNAIKVQGNLNIIKENNIKASNSLFGILIDQGNLNIVTDNDISDSRANGISLIKGSTKNYMARNNIHGVITGISFIDSPNNTVFYNTINSDLDSIDIINSNKNNLTLNTLISTQGSAIQLLGSTTTLIYNNILLDSGLFGVLLSDSPSNLILNNTIIGSKESGIGFVNSSNNQVTNNTLKTNKVGIYLNLSNSNIIYNNFFANILNAQDYGTNRYNITKTAGTNIVRGPFLGGNFWSDYNGTDLTGDYIGDTKIPYNSSGNIKGFGDFLPLLINTPPTLEFIFNTTVIATTNLTIRLNATDIDSGTLIYGAAPIPTGATFNTNTGVFSWIPLQSQVGNYTINFSVTDQINTASQLVKIAVLALPPPSNTTYQPGGSPIFVKIKSKGGGPES